MKSDEMKARKLFEKFFLGHVGPIGEQVIEAMALALHSERQKQRERDAEIARSMYLDAHDIEKAILSQEDL